MRKIADWQYGGINKYRSFDSMKEQGNSAENISVYVEPKEGEHQLLPCSAADVCSPSLGFNPNSPLMSREIALDYLAGVLVEAYFDHKERERNAGRHPEESGNILPSID